MLGWRSLLEQTVGKMVQMLGRKVAGLEWRTLMHDLITVSEEERASVLSPNPCTIPVCFLP